MCLIIDRFALFYYEILILILNRVLIYWTFQHSNSIIGKVWLFFIIIEWKKGRIGWHWRSARSGHDGYFGQNRKIQRQRRSQAKTKAGPRSWKFRPCRRFHPQIVIFILINQLIFLSTRNCQIFNFILYLF